MQTKTMWSGVLVLAAIAVGSNPAWAALETVAGGCPGAKTVCLWQQPRLDPPAGWERAKAASEHYQAAAFVPVDANFNTAPAVMYAKAVPAQSASLAGFMAGDIADFRHQYPDLQVQTGLSSVDGDGRSLATIRLAPGTGGQAQWQTIAYGQEGGHILVFSLSARDRASHDAALPAFQQLLRGYHAGTAAAH